jgi:sterol O-acyltransferase
MLASCLLAVLLYVSSTHFLPVVDRINELSIVQAWGLLVIPTLIIWLSVFFLTFECITNAFAEMTHFAARTTYLRWWCSTSFLEFSRSWNLPVHTFLHKHVYQRIRNHGFDASAGRTITFLVSIVLHEILLWGLFGTGIPYLALFSLTQLPLMFIMKSKIIQGRRLGNLVFWAGMIMGTTLVTVLYAKDYCSIQGHCRVLPPPEL